MKSARGILTRAAAVGFAPPLAVMGVRVGGWSDWNLEPLVLGSALWVTIAMAFAAVALARLERQTRAPR